MRDVALRSPAVCEVVGVTYRQLDYWARTGLIMPTIPARGSGTQRLYSLDDVVLVRLVAVMLNGAASTGRVERLRPAVSLVRNALADTPDGPLWLVMPTGSRGPAVTTELDSTLREVGETAVVVVDLRSIVEDMRRAVAGRRAVAS